MRRVHLTDLNIATRVLMAADESCRHGIAAELIANAQIADRYRKRTGRNHFVWGAGSLADACRNHPRAMRPLGCDPLFLTCLATVITALRIP